MSRTQTFIDSAGAVGGGSARFLRELKKYLAAVARPDVTLFGDDRQLSAAWLVQRELLARAAGRRISLNNVGFANPFGANITLLRNILQFATSEEMDQLGFTPSRRLKVQTPVVRALAHASETLVVPCTRMAEQVCQIAPALADKLVVRFHPVAQPSWAGQAPQNSHDILVPIVPQPYKNLDQHLPEILDATEGLVGRSIRIVVPSSPDKLPALVGNPRVVFIGPQSSENLDQWWRRCGAVFFPVEFESFGYALAESRVYGRHIIAQDSAQNHEIAGNALRSYRRHDRESLRAAVAEAVAGVPKPDADPFDPQTYFEWLLEGAERPARSVMSKEETK